DVCRFVNQQPRKIGGFSDDGSPLDCGIRVGSSQPVFRQNDESVEGSLFFVTGLVRVRIVPAVHNSFGDDLRGRPGFVVASVEKGYALAAGVASSSSRSSRELTEQGKRELLFLARSDQEQTSGLEPLRLVNDTGVVQRGLELAGAQHGRHYAAGGLVERNQR